MDLRCYIYTDIPNKTGNGSLNRGDPRERACQILLEGCCPLGNQVYQSGCPTMTGGCPARQGMKW